VSDQQCESCTMPIEAGPYCPHCADESGRLHAFEEVFERFQQWTRRNESGLDEGEVRKKVFAFMARTPAWRDHPEVRANA